MGKIKGDRLYIFGYDSAAKKWQAIAQSTDCSLNIAGETIEISPDALWRRYRRGRLGWTVSCGGFYFKKQLLKLQERAQQKAPIRICMSVLASEIVDKGVNPETVSRSSDEMYSGDALITNIDISGTKGALAVYSIEFQGTGKIDYESV